MNENDLVLLREQYARQTAAWNALKERFSALPDAMVRVTAEWLDDLNAIGDRARAQAAVPVPLLVRVAVKV